MKLSALALREKVAPLPTQFLNAERDGLSMDFENGLVMVVRTKYPEEPTYYIPLSNVLGMRGLPPVIPGAKKKTPAGEPVPEPPPEAEKPAKK